MRVTPEEVGKIRAALFEAKTQLKEMDNTVKLCDTVMDLYRELAESQAMTLRWKKAVEGLTPSGSEFVDDPERCAAHIRQRCQYPPIIIRLKEELAESQSRVASAFEAAADVIDKFYPDKYNDVPSGGMIRCLTPRAADLTMKLKVARAVFDESQFWSNHGTASLSRTERDHYEEIKNRLSEIEAEIAKGNVR